MTTKEGGHVNRGGGRKTKRPKCCTRGCKNPVHGFRVDEPINGKKIFLCVQCRKCCLWHGGQSATRRI
jgi:hypothetical protein